MDWHRPGERRKFRAGHIALLQLELVGNAGDRFAVGEVTDVFGRERRRFVRVLLGEQLFEAAEDVALLPVELGRREAELHHALGLEETDDGIWSIYFHTVLLAKLDEHDYIIRG